MTVRQLRPGGQRNQPAPGSLKGRAAIGIAAQIVATAEPVVNRLSVPSSACNSLVSSLERR